MWKDVQKKKVPIDTPVLVTDGKKIVLCKISSETKKIKYFNNENDKVLLVPETFLEMWPVGITGDLSEMAFDLLPYEITHWDYPPKLPIKAGL